MESSLTHGEPCVGLEIEGLATLKFEWNEAGKQRIDALRRATESGNTEPVEQFAQTFKRTRLIRSISYESFSAAAESARDPDNRGVYAVPEEDKRNWQNYGTTNPAELVSAPHRLTAPGLRFLRNSVRKVAVPATSGPYADRAFTTRPNALDAQLGATHTAEIRLEGSDTTGVVTTEWIRGGRGTGGYQTTIGVPVNELMACAHKDDQSPDPLRLLVFDPGKRLKIRHLLAATHYIAGGILEGSHFTPLEIQGLELALLSDLYARMCLDQKGGGMAKDALGMNLKGYTSFSACGFPHNRLAKSLATTVEPTVKAYMETPACPEYIKTVLRQYSAYKLGEPDLSIQATVEKGPTIANFIYTDRLFTVIEARESNAEINTLMSKLVNTVPRAAGTDAEKIVNPTLVTIDAHIHFTGPVSQSSSSSTAPPQESENPSG